MSVKWHYKAPEHKNDLIIPQEASIPSSDALLGTEGPNPMYSRPKVSNLDSNPKARGCFDRAYLLFLGFHHEEAAYMFQRCVDLAPNCALAYGMLALCHAPNYNFNGDTYYQSTNHLDGEEDGAFPSQQMAEKYSGLALSKVEEMNRGVSKGEKISNGKRNNRRKSLKRRSSSRGNNLSSSIDTTISEQECAFLNAIRTLTSMPGIDPSFAEEHLGRPYSEKLARLYGRYPSNADISYFYAESLMILNAWNLYEYPTGRSLSPDVALIRRVLEAGIAEHPSHPGLCHLYVHLCEMSSSPQDALDACLSLRKLTDYGHLIHMVTHIDVLVGDYNSVVHYNLLAIQSDLNMMCHRPSTSGILSLYFGYAVHNFHMLVYGCILGAMQRVALQYATHLNSYLNENQFLQNYELASYLESYSALDIHIFVRFGRWNEILELELPQYPEVMLFRTTSLRFARGLAYANLGLIENAETEADLHDSISRNTLGKDRILHNNDITSILAIDRPMLRGEIAYRKGEYEEAFRLLRQSVELQDELNYDEPWGKMQPVRHALGGLLFEQGHVAEAEEVFRADLKFHPKNPWGLCGLISCLEKKLRISMEETKDDIRLELQQLRYQYDQHYTYEFVDFEVTVPCLCCSNCKKKTCCGK